MERSVSQPAIRSRLLLLGEDPDQAQRLLPLVSRCTRAEVRYVQTGMDLLEQYVSRRTAAIVIDSEVAGPDTQQIVHIIRSVDRDCRVILLLTEANMGTFNSLLELDGVSYLLKPVSEDLLAHMVCSSLGFKTGRKTSPASDSMTRRSTSSAEDRE